MPNTMLGASDIKTKKIGTVPQKSCNWLGDIDL